MGQYLLLQPKVIGENLKEIRWNYYRLAYENAYIAVIWKSMSFGIVQNIFYAAQMLMYKRYHNNCPQFLNHTYMYNMMWSAVIPTKVIYYTCRLES